MNSRRHALKSVAAATGLSALGLPLTTWAQSGELVVAALVAKAGLDQHQLNQWMRAQMPAYKTPRKYLLVKELPRNAMGKVVKNEVKILFQ